MCQGADRRLCNDSESCHVRKVARLSARPLSQKDLSELARVSTGTVYRVETGRRGAYPGTVRKLAKALAVAPEALVHGKKT